MAKRSAIDKAIRNLMGWADQPQWAEEQTEVFDKHLEPVCEHLDMDQQSLLEALEPSGHLGMLFGIVFEDFLGRRFPPDDRNLVDDYLKRRGWRETAPGRRYLEQLRDSTLSLYEVIAVEPGKYCDLRDLLRDPDGETIRVFEQLGTKSLHKWDRIAARVLRMNKRYVFSGGILPYPRDASQMLLRTLDEAWKSFDAALAELDDVDIREKLSSMATFELFVHNSGVSFTTVWLVHLLERQLEPLPDMVNRDREALVFVETRFPIIGGQAAAIAERLDGDPEWDRDTPDMKSWIWIASRSSSDDMAAHDPAAEGQVDEQPVNGSLEMRERALILSTNSKARARRGQQALETLLKDLVGPALSMLQTPEQMLQQEEGVEPQGDDGNDAEIATEVIHRYLDQHYRKCLDEPIPMLDNRTPRQCAASKAHRDRVIDWLKQMENNELHRAQADGQTAYDCQWIWAELGIPRD